MLLIESLELHCTECLDLAGASVKCEASTVIVSRRETTTTITCDSESGASLWAEQIALACGHTESIAKLLSMQRHRINSLEQRCSAQTSLNKDEVERCLNFLSREYVEMRYQVRKGEPEESTEEKFRKENCSAEESIPAEKQAFEPETEPVNKAASPRAPRVSRNALEGALREAQRSPGGRLRPSPKQREIVDRKGHRRPRVQAEGERRTARSSGRN